MNCKYFDECSAPMCPKDEGAAQAVWFVDESICRLHDVPEWVKRQKKIFKAGLSEMAGYFTLPMLERHCVIGKKMTGIDADTDMKIAEENWLEKHPPVKQKTDEERERLAARMRFVKCNPSLATGVKNRIPLGENGYGRIKK